MERHCRVSFGVRVVGLGGAGTVSHMGGRVDFTLCSQCQALGQALVFSHQGRGVYGWCCIVVTLPCGYCLKASMTVKDGPGVHRFHPHL